jgi:hypothetical protein
LDLKRDFADRLKLLKLNEKVKWDELVKQIGEKEIEKYLKNVNIPDTENIIIEKIFGSNTLHWLHDKSGAWKPEWDK